MPNLVAKFYITMKKFIPVIFLIVVFFTSSLLQAQVVLNPIPNQCENGPTYILNEGMPAGGTYSGPGVFADNFSPVIAGVGVHEISYVYTDTITLIPDTALQTVIVYPAPTVIFSTVANICVNSQIKLQNFVSPIGGTFNGAGVTNNNTFDASLTGTGNFLVTYTYVDTTTGCADSATQNMVVNGLPPTALAAIPDYCSDSNFVTLTGGSPAGGKYVINTIDTIIGFTPNQYPEGNYTITYYFTDNNKCSNSASRNFNIFDIPEKSTVFPWAPDTLISLVVGDNYQWFKNDTGIVGNDRKLYVSSQSGYYSVKVIKNGCEGEMSNRYQYGIPYSVNENITEQNFLVYPNPNTGSFYIELENFDLIGSKLIVFNALGQNVVDKTITNKQLEITGLTPGVYYINTLKTGVLSKVVVTK